MPALAKAFEYAAMIFRPDADAGIAHAECDAPIGLAAGETGDLSAAGREFDRIGQQIDHDLADRAFIGAQAGQILSDLGNQGDACLLRLDHHHRDGIGNHVGKVHLVVAQHHAPRLDLCEVQNIVDQGQEVVAGAVNVTAIFGVLLDGIAEGAGFDDFRKAQNGVQRRAQFVAHIGQEGRFGAAGGFRPVARLVRNFLGALQVFDQACALPLQFHFFAAGFVIGESLCRHHQPEAEIEPAEDRAHAAAVKDRGARHRHQVDRKRDIDHRQIDSPARHPARQRCAQDEDQQQLVAEHVGRPQHEHHRAPRHHQHAGDDGGHLCAIADRLWRTVVRFQEAAVFEFACRAKCGDDGGPCDQIDGRHPADIGDRDQRGGNGQDETGRRHRLARGGKLRMGDAQILFAFRQEGAAESFGHAGKRPPCRRACRQAGCGATLFDFIVSVHFLAGSARTME